MRKSSKQFRKRRKMHKSRLERLKFRLHEVSELSSGLVSVTK